jgi:hypothetical protein
MTVEAKIEIQPQVVVAEKAIISLSPAQIQKIQEASAILKKLSWEELAEVAGAFRTMQDVYPLLRSDTPKDLSKDYETRRAEFKPIIDKLECALVVLEKHFPEDFPTFHKFTPGMYIREIHVPAGSIFTSVTHKTQHPFVISRGVCDICNEIGDVQRYSAPHTGITEPETRRVFLVHEDLVLTTFHVTEITDPDQWLLENTAIENEALPEGTTPMCFSKEDVKWRA